MSACLIEMEESSILRVKYGEPAKNDKIVQDAEKRLLQLIDTGVIIGGELIRINGPMTLPTAMVFAHKLAHLYQAVACYDPKLSKYVVTITHGNDYKLGDLID